MSLCRLAACSCKLVHSVAHIVACVLGEVERRPSHCLVASRFFFTLNVVGEGSSVVEVLHSGRKYVVSYDSTTAVVL